MKVDYNPQVGYRRTIFPDCFDFLMKIDSFEVKEDLTFSVETYLGKKAFVKIAMLECDAFEFQMYLEERKCNRVFDFSKRVPGTFKEQDSYYEYSAGKCSLKFQKDFWEMSVYYNGKLMAKEQIFDTNVDNRWKTLPIGFYLDSSGNISGVRENMYLFSDEAFWGFGEKFTELNKRGQKIHCWQKDALSTNTEDSYKTHPFFISSRGYGILLNTFTRSEFDMGCTSQVGYQMSAEDKVLDYVFFLSDGDYKTILKHYIEMTGKIPTIPRWALGFWMSKCSYQNRQEIEEVVTTARQKGLPIDVIHVDDWQRHENIGAWEWDTVRYPNPEEMIQWLAKEKVHLSIWNWPYLGEKAESFSELEKRGFFVKNKNGEMSLFFPTADATEKVACFDFTNPECMKWYKEQIKKVLATGISVIKTDFSEAVPEDAVYFDGSNGVEGHNKITYLYAQTVYETMEESCKETGVKPLIWCRSGFCGSHRIPAAWAGDSSSSINNHAAILKGGLSLAMSGVAYWGYDLGGFYNTGTDGNESMPTEEEYVSSFAMGLYMPLSRAHGKTPREPWNYTNAVFEQVKRIDEERHRLLPYLSSTMLQSNIESLPMLRPLFLEFPNDYGARTQELSYMLGDNLLVAPIFEEKTYPVYLPEGKWFDLRKGEVLDGGRYIMVSVERGETAVFQRENSIIPKLPAEYLQYVPQGELPALVLQIFYTGEMCAGYYDYGQDEEIVRQQFKAYFGEDEKIHIQTDINFSDIQIVGEYSTKEIIVE